jgi:hypothetical protein
LIGASGLFDTTDQTWLTVGVQVMTFAPVPEAGNAVTFESMVAVIVDGWSGKSCQVIDRPAHDASTLAWWPAP